MLYIVNYDWYSVRDFLLSLAYEAKWVQIGSALPSNYQCEKLYDLN